MRMRRLPVALLMTLLSIAVLSATPALAGVVRYVNAGVSESGDGTSWTEAFSCLGGALEAPGTFDEIWVKAGTYRPTTTTDRTVSFIMQPGVAIYGGFAGTESERDSRDWVANATVLSGDIGAAGVNTDNSYTVVRGASNARLDGFTITGGYADGAGIPNEPGLSGGGMYNASVEDLVVENCTFSGNEAVQCGGGIFSRESSLTIASCTFSGNEAFTGGGMRCDHSSTAIMNSTFSGNSATSGGGVFNHESVPTITNCTFVGNSAHEGDGMYNNYSGPIVTNCIFWENSADGGNEAAIYNCSSSVSTVTYSCIESWTSGGEGNTAENPMFVDTAAGNFRLLEGSPCIDAGTNVPFEAGGPAFGVTTDLDGNDRIVGSSVDIGAYERQLRILLVKHDAVGGGDGTSWEDAFTCLQLALATAAAGDEIWVAAGTYRPSAQTDPEDPRSATFTMVEGVAIYGGYCGTENEVRDWVVHETVLCGDLLGNDAGSVASRADNSYNVVTGASDAVLDGFTITRGNASATGDTFSPHRSGGGMRNSDVTNLAIANCVFSQNLAGSGGGMYNSNSSPAVTNCTFNWNSAGMGGGMFNNEYSSPTVTSCSFTGNTATIGGGLANRSHSSPTITTCTFNWNSASLGAGGMRNEDSSPTVADCMFSENDGGGIQNMGGSPIITNCTFRENRAYSGGGIYNSSSSPIITNCSFSGNSATSGGGGGVYNINSSPTIEGCEFSWNSAFDGGGAMYNNNSSPAIEDCVFSRNSTRFSGGGGMYNNESSPNVENCVFSENSAASIGGGMHNYKSSPTITNCTFSLNSALDGGGGMLNEESLPIVTNCTFSGNLAISGGGMLNCSSNPAITNSIFWRNMAFDAVSLLNNDSTPVVKYSCVEGGHEGEGNIARDPMFVDAQGGDFRLRAESPCVDAGDTAAVPAGVTTDLDGNPRVAGVSVDMGAYERQPASGGDDGPSGGGGTGGCGPSGRAPTALALILLVAAFAGMRPRCSGAA